MAPYAVTSVDVSFMIIGRRAILLIGAPYDIRLYIWGVRR